ERRGRHSQAECGNGRGSGFVVSLCGISVWPDPGPPRKPPAADVIPNRMIEADRPHDPHRPRNFLAMSDTSFDGLRVAAFEARLAGPMADLIRKHGGQPVEAPALREVPIGENPEAVRFAERLRDGGYDVVIFLTGVGARYLLEEVKPRVPREEFL